MGAPRSAMRGRGGAAPVGRRIGASAHLFLSRLGDLLDLAEPASGTSDRRLTQLRLTVDEAAAKFWRCTGGLVGASCPEALRETEAKRAFMASMCGGATNGGVGASGGTESVKKSSKKSARSREAYVDGAAAVEAAAATPRRHKSGKPPRWVN